MTTRVVLAACSAGVFACAASGAIVSYDPSLGSLPTSQGFSYLGSVAEPIDTDGDVLSHGPTTNLGMSAWEAHFPQGTMNFATSTWSASMRVRLTNSDFGMVEGARRAGYHMFISDDAGRWVIAELGSSTIGLRNDAIGATDPSVAAPMHSDFRTVTVEAGPSGARLYLDGVLQTTLALGTNHTVRNHFLWGDGSTTTHVDLAQVQHVTLVPSPGPVVLAGCGALVMLRRRRR